MSNLRYTDEHVWLRLDGDVATIGITHHAQETLGDIVFVDLPEIGRRIAARDVAGVVESVKAAADVYMPLDGEVTELNEALRSDPALANSDPLGAGWFFRARLSDPGAAQGLLDDAAYKALTAS